MLPNRRSQSHSHVAGWLAFSCPRCRSIRFALQATCQVNRNAQFLVWCASLQVICQTPQSTHPPADSVTLWFSLQVSGWGMLRGGSCCHGRPLNQVRGQGHHECPTPRAWHVLLLQYLMLKPIAEHDLSAPKQCLDVACICIAVSRWVGW